MINIEEIAKQLQQKCNDIYESDVFEQVKKSIKHPRFYYAVIDADTKTVTYKRKKWRKWFSSKRVVAIKIGTFDLSNSLPEYKKRA